MASHRVTLHAGGRFGGYKAIGTNIGAGRSSGRAWQSAFGNGTGAATHGLGLLQELGMRVEQLRVKGGEETGGGGARGCAQAFLESGH